MYYLFLEVQNMGITRYNRAKEFISFLKHTYKTDTIKFDLLISEIRKRLGDDEKGTIRPYIKLMRDEGLIKQMADSSMIKLGDINES